MKNFMVWVTCESVNSNIVSKSQWFLDVTENNTDFGILFFFHFPLYSNERCIPMIKNY